MIDRLLTLAMVAIFVLVAALLLFGLYTAADSLFVADQSAVAVVVGRNHSPEWVELQTVSTGESTTTIPVMHPETWSLAFELGGKRGNHDVDSYIFHTVRDGREVPITYRTGRFSGWLYVTGADFSER